jgi:hypothetical protein
MKGKLRKLNAIITNSRKDPEILFLLCMLLSTFSMHGQTTDYKQFSPEFQLNRVFSDKMALELDVNGTFSNTPSENKVFKTLIQGAGLIWVHYFISPRWKLSSNLGYYNNHDQPEIGQFNSTEWRFGLQANYYINKIGFTLSTKLRPEVRFVTNEEGNYEDIYRYRQMLKFIKPINSQLLRQGTYYAVASEELFFRSTRKSGGFHYFDRNMFAFGGGYMLTDNLQLELTYTNEFIPRDDGDQLNNQITITFITNNLFLNIKDRVAELFSSDDEN